MQQCCGPVKKSWNLAFGCQISSDNTTQENKSRNPIFSSLRVLHIGEAVGNNPELEFMR